MNVMIPVTLSIYMWAGMFVEPRVKLHDLEFRCAVEHSIAMEFGLSPPRRWVVEFARLASDSYDVRESATVELTHLAVRRPQWLWWGLLSRDPEVRLRTTMLIRKRYPCHSCFGVGIYTYRDRSTQPCYFCKGLYLSPWEWDEWGWRN